MVACNKHSINIQKDPSASTESCCAVTSGLQLYPDAPALGSPSSPKQRRETYVLETGIELQEGLTQGRYKNSQDSKVEGIPSLVPSLSGMGSYKEDTGGQSSCGQRRSHGAWRSLNRKRMLITRRRYI